MAVSLKFEMPEEQHSQLVQLATDMGLPLEVMMADAAAEYLAYWRPVIDGELQAERDFEAGDTIPHEEVVAWVQSLGTANALPSPLERRLSKAS